MSPNQNDLHSSWRFVKENIQDDRKHKKSGWFSTYHDLNLEECDEKVRQSSYGPWLGNPSRSGYEGIYSGKMV